eukprot:7391423-Prymnesium_polylepis.3
MKTLARHPVTMGSMAGGVCGEGVGLHAARNLTTAAAADGVSSRPSQKAESIKIRTFRHHTWGAAIKRARSPASGHPDEDRPHRYGVRRCQQQQFGSLGRGNELHGSYHKDQHEQGKREEDEEDEDACCAVAARTECKVRPSLARACWLLDDRLTICSLAKAKVAADGR